MQLACSSRLAFFLMLWTFELIIYRSLLPALKSEIRKKPVFCRSGCKSFDDSQSECCAIGLALALPNIPKTGALKPCFQPSDLGKSQLYK
jgi:hypothetical protein